MRDRAVTYVHLKGGHPRFTAKPHPRSTTTEKKIHGARQIPISPLQL
jgi:hypothetical protein